MLAFGQRSALFAVLVARASLSACASSAPLNPWTTDATPMALVPIADAGVVDRRGRFREIFCTVLESREQEWPDYRPCDEALTRVGHEPAGDGDAPVLSASESGLLALLVPGVGWECISEWLQLDDSVADLVSEFGFDAQVLEVDGLSGSSHNALQIRDGILGLPLEQAQRPLLLIGYSKGAPDILEALVAYPELADRVTAVISVAGAVGGSPLAAGADQGDLNLLRYFPGAECSEGDGQAVDSLRPEVRRNWLANHELPSNVAYYSLVTYPHPERISSALGGFHRKLGKVDMRNDSQLIFYDQIIPGSTLLGFVNADHWAIAVPIARSHRFLGSTFVDQNDYPREALVEAVMRFIEEDLEARTLRNDADEASY